MREQVLFIVIVAIIIGLISGCIHPGFPQAQPSPSPSPPPTQAIPLAIHLNATPSRYSPVMSSTIGIRLTPVNTSGIIPLGALFTWETTFGSFYHWGPPDFKVVELGALYTGDQEPVYWSYFSEHGEKERKPVTITLTVQEPATGKVIANASLRIGWEPPDSFTAVVENSG
ncbi:MAG: hypothetical protein LUQ49_02150 [Methanomicrobiales archaeon]|nr:hypothetical protein [Methanomicrobiales archaeon]